MANKRRTQLDAMLEAVAEAAAAPHGPDSLEALKKALAHKNWLVVSEAASVVGEHTLSELQAELTEVWSRLLAGGAKADPGCRAKEAALTALDRLEIYDPEPFTAAVRYRQWEYVGKQRFDTAGGVRVRCLSALLRMHFSQAVLLSGELMADADPQVRSGVARALGYYGDAATGGVLAMKLHLGDDDPVVISEAMVALMSVAPEYGLCLGEDWLGQDDDVRREAAALAFGQAERQGGVAALIRWVQSGLGEADFELAARGLGLSRSEQARELLLSEVRDSSGPRAKAALSALAVHSYDPALAERALDAAAANARVKLTPLANKLFARG